MPKNLRGKWILILLVLAACIAGVVWRPVRLGLDLKGGSHITLQIQVQDAFKAEADLLMERLKQALQKESINYVSMDRNDPQSIDAAAGIRVDVRGVSDAHAADFRRIVDATAPEWTVASEGSDGYRLALSAAAAQKLRDDTLVQSMNTIEKKVNGLGVSEATVQRQGGEGGDTELLVQLPGVDDPARIRAILQTSAMLELCEVKGGPYASRDAALSANGGILPLGTKLAGGAQAWWLVARSPVITGRDLRNASAQPGEMPGRWDTAFTLTQEAAQRFERFTGANIGRRLAILLDNQVLSAPQVDAKIADQGRIMGAGTQQEASDLALNLRAGSLPAGAKVIKERRVGPSLGADSIRSGVSSGVVGLALIIAAMVLYYRGAGVNAVLALLLNAVMTVAALNYLDTAWTLPGIAGLVLSIGMAVDSNILIFERIKEELRAGKNASAAVSAGFDRAFATIMDTHVTTVVASAFLFVFGTGPVRGFAVTLVIGLVANLFTAVFVSRAMFDLQLRRRGSKQQLQIGGRTELFPETHIDFLSRRALTLGLSVLAIGISIASLMAQGGPKYGLDFRGGTLIYAVVQPKPNLDDLRGTLSSKLKGEFSLQESRDTGEIIIGTQLADEETLDHASRAVEQTLREKYEGAGGKVEIRSSELVSPRASSEMRRQALLATAGALGGMLAYVGLRFRLVSGAAAVIATIHDVLITLGLFSLTGREIDLTVIAALLTLIGYSMNDKIVVFDRVRENLRGRRADGASFLAVVNESINQTLSRTILTGGLTLLACLALYVLGGKVLNGIAFALCAGIVIGTYSSIFVASALLVMWQRHTEKRTGVAIEPRPVRP